MNFGLQRVKLFPKTTSLQIRTEGNIIRKTDNTWGAQLFLQIGYLQVPKDIGPLRVKHNGKIIRDVIKCFTLYCLSSIINTF
jgi:hypothetical protein